MKWTRETIYADPKQVVYSPDPKVNGRPAPIPPKVNIGLVRSGLSRLFTPEFAAEVIRETRWVRLERTSEELEASIRAAMKKKEKCPACHDSTRYARCQGLDTGLEIVAPVYCECMFLGRLQRELDTIPERFAEARLDTLAWSPKSKLPREQQETIIEFVKKHPEDSFLLMGEPGTGKTHISIALYCAALEKSMREQFLRGDIQSQVWRISATVLLQQHIAWDTRNIHDENSATPSPVVTERMITAAAQKGYRPSLFLDEIDKIVPSDYKLSRLFEIIDAVYAHNGQVVATSNKTVNQLASKWGADEAESILRRISNGERAHKLNFSLTSRAKTDDPRSVEEVIEKKSKAPLIDNVVKYSDVEIHDKNVRKEPSPGPAPSATKRETASTAQTPPARVKNPMENLAAAAAAKRRN
ncbi:MAG: ATP-binding protein [Acidobacterium ailaaui]|nr:ATP-binding protein [Pseudacidobacterium ailaaui]